MLFGYGIKGSVSGSAFKTRAFWTGLLTLTLFNTTVVYSYMVAPDWMWMYFVDDNTIPQWIVSYVFVMYYLAFVFGFLLKNELSKICPKLTLGVTLLFLIASGLVIVPVLDQYLNVTTYGAYLAGGKGIPLPESLIGKGYPSYFVPVVLIVGIASLIWSRRQSCS
jgi:hypothetical protein